MEEQLKQDIKVFGIPPEEEPPKRYPLNVCDNVAREIGEPHTVIKYHYGDY